MAPLPSNWPMTVQYLHGPKPQKGFDMLKLRAPSSSHDVLPVSDASSGPSKKVKIKAITDSTHPAKGEYGLFAACNLRPDSFIIQYLGLYHDAEGSDPESSYDLSLSCDDFPAAGIDATHCGNEARFINDYRGINTDGPNAEFRDCWVDLRDGHAEKRIAVYVLPAGKSGKRSKGILKGEEILVSYGKGFWSHRQTGS